MRVLVTGGAGFIGTNLVHELIRRSEVSFVTVLDALTYAGNRINLEDIADLAKFRFIKADIRNFEETHRIIDESNCDYVFHLAAESHVDRSITGPAEFVETNVLGTFNLLEACRDTWPTGYDGKRFVHVSTDEVYGSLGADGCFTEDSPYAPRSPYSASKAASDHLVQAYFHTYGFPAIVTHCSNNYGPYQFPEKLIPKTIAKAMKSDSIPVYGDGKNVRDWIHVSDHVEALWKILASGTDGETYNIGGDNEIPNIELVNSICDTVDEVLSRKAGTSRNLIQFVTDRLGHYFRYAIDSSKVASQLGWHAQREFRPSMEETIRWYIDNATWVEAMLEDDRN